MGRYVWPEYLFLTLRLCYWISFIPNPHTCVHSCIMSCTQFYIYKEEQISHGASGRKWWSFSEREARTTKQQQLEETPDSLFGCLRRTAKKANLSRALPPECRWLKNPTDAGLWLELQTKDWCEKRGSWMRLFMLQQSRSPSATLPPSFWPLRTKVNIWA